MGSVCAFQRDLEQLQRKYLKTKKLIKKHKTEHTFRNMLLIIQLQLPLVTSILMLQHRMQVKN